LGELPFSFVTPERVIEGKTTCVTNNYGNGGRHQNNNVKPTNSWNYNGIGSPNQKPTGSTYTSCTTIPPG
jgi:hypothetical protein